MTPGRVEIYILVVVIIILILIIVQRLPVHSEYVVFKI